MTIEKKGDRIYKVWSNGSPKNYRLFGVLN